MAGVPVALRRKFSAREFASDLARYGATATLYVGDVCRALVHSPVTPAESALQLRVAVGNGLEAQVWTEFQRRFGRPQIREFLRLDRSARRGLEPDRPRGLARSHPVRAGGAGSAWLASTRNGSNSRATRTQAVRSSAARTSRVSFLFRVFPNAEAPHGAFGGYTDEAASRARIAVDVFEAGDAYFRSGDVLRRDRHGFFYFVDRLGDGFRWKGENVSALEVQRVLDAGLGFPGVAVFGVAVPGYPGRAGFAEVVSPASSPFDAEAFARASLALPAHARPCFVRPVAALELTSSFKIRKHTLDLSSARLHEALWVRQNGRYVVLTQKLWDDLCRGQARL